MSKQLSMVENDESLLQLSVHRHTVHRYSGHPLDLIGLIKSERRTGVIMLHVNQGSIYSMEFDARAKETAPAPHNLSVVQNNI